MTRITQKSAVAPFNPWANISTGVANTAYAAIPANGAQPTTGVGFYQPDLDTQVGLKFDSSDGREFALVRNGAVAIGPGKLVQTGAEVTAHEKLAITVPSTYPATAGLYQVYVTNGSTVLNVNKFQGGTLVVASGTGAGQSFKIASHQAAAANASFVVTLEDPIQTTLDATSTVSLLRNAYADVIVSPTSATGAPVGVTITNLPASTAATYNATSGALTANGVAQYGLIQTHGPVAVLIDTTTTVGYPLGKSASVAGALTVATLTTAPFVAISAQTQTDAQYGVVNLLL